MRISQHLEALYGPSVGSRVSKKLHALLDACRGQLAQSGLNNNSIPLSERDAILITYADQVRVPGEPPLRTLADFAATHLRGLISGVHLLPFYPWSSDDGFSVKDYFAVDPAYGSWQEIARLGGKFELMFDAVFNHLSAQSDWFQKFLKDEPQFRDFFVTVSGTPDLSAVVRPRARPLLTEFQTASGPRRVWTTFSPDQVDLDFHNPEVLLAVTEALLFYVRQGARFIRLDAIAFLWKEVGTSCLHLPQTHRIIHLMRAVLDEVAPGVRLITETNVPHADNLSYFGDGTNEAQLVYNFALPPLVLHSFQTGSAAALTRWAQSLALPSSPVTLFNFLASHDGIGLNPVRGILSEAEIENLVARTLATGGLVSYKSLPNGATVPYELNINYLDAISPPAGGDSLPMVARKFLTAQAIMLNLQGVPGIYFHSLFGSRGDAAAARVTGLNRRINREKLERAALEQALDDPTSIRSLVFEKCSALLRERRRHPAFAPGSAQTVLDLGSRVFAVLRETADGTERLLCMHNVSSSLVTVSPPGATSVVSLQPFGFEIVDLK